MLFFVCVYAWLLYHVQRHPEFAPYLNQSKLSSIRTVLYWALGAYVGVIAAAMALRRQNPESRLLVWPTAALYVCVVIYASHVFGAQTNMLTGVLPIGGAVIGAILLEVRPVVISICLFVFLGALAGLTLGHFLLGIPYAPLLVDAPFHDGRLEPSWAVGVGGVALSILCVQAVLVAYLVKLWHDREARLARANEIISRYVASQLAAEIRAGKDASLRHERRKLTLFFSDIADFSTIADQVEPEDLSNVLNEYLSEMAVIGERYGATIDKFVGDAIMIFFGAPMPAIESDQAIRAVRMAVDMQARLSILCEQWIRRGFEHRFVVRIGINTGHATIGNFGSQSRMDYTAIGRQVNLAARLQAQCQPGRILLSHSTWVLVRDEIPCRPQGEILVKGFHLPVKIYEVEVDPAPTVA